MRKRAKLPLTIFPWALRGLADAADTAGTASAEGAAGFVDAADAADVANAADVAAAAAAAQRRAGTGQRTAGDTAELAKLTGLLWGEVHAGWIAAARGVPPALWVWSELSIKQRAKTVGRRWQSRAGRNKNMEQGRVE
eukprot:CAMPEP_0177659436 /NCGR_PEP_ID=MMETSP0447-20121125/17441_1 /TAXON_ID=0 /ORGANISM="Stygamoeba regulata, Strain BSH-02190019" /LENGTH=137 /DNA_ID=CAMNT_0019164305 /DNA_START=413 /DNA_END=826 /DNA_ORIENTATION=+